MTTRREPLGSKGTPTTEAPRSDPIRAEHIMTSTVIAVDPDRPLREVVDLLLSNEISGLPVVDVEGIVLGMITEADLIAKEEGTDPLARSEPIITLRNKTKRFFQAYRGSTAGGAMSAPPITASPETPARELAATMRKHGIKAVPIVVEGRLRGLVTRRDVLKVFQRSDAELKEAVVSKLKHLGVHEPQIEVDVTEGVVVLSGRVSTRSRLVLLEETVPSLDSVIGVDTDRLRFEHDDIAVEYRGF